MQLKRIHLIVKITKNKKGNRTLKKFIISVELGTIIFRPLDHGFCDRFSRDCCLCSINLFVRKKAASEIAVKNGALY